MSYTGTEPCAQCEHPLSRHPPDEPCCKRCSGWVPVSSDVERIAQLEAACAAKDEALEEVVAAWKVDLPQGYRLHDALNQARAALAPDAGKALLERVRQLEAQIAAFREAAQDALGDYRAGLPIRPVYEQRLQVLATGPTDAWQRALWLERAYEREACAKVADELADIEDGDLVGAAIRARGDK